MKLFNYYSMDECTDRKKVINKLKSLEGDGKVEYSLDQVTDIFKITDLDLEDEDIEDLIKIFDQNDVFPYLDYNEDDEENGDDSYDDDESDDY